MLNAVYPKLRSWIASATSPSTTHASGMLILLGILAAVTDAHSVKEPIRVHHPKVSSPSSSSDEEPAAEAQPMSNKDMLYYVAMGMLVSQGLIRLLTFIVNRREAAKQNANKDNKGKGKKSSGLSLNALEDLDPETLKKRRAEHLATLDHNAELLGSDTEDDDYEGGSDSESESESEDEDVEEEEGLEDDEDLDEV
ncbi:hypothetical protein BGZ98_005297, partial [Dissophora globulifera]